MTNPTPGNPGHRIREFEGLRGCLAWWVVLFHLSLYAKVDLASLTKLEGMIALGGWQAVELFIILSGFVITLLLEVEQEGYGIYIIRRFFRLAPVYYVLLVYGIGVAIVQGSYGDRLWNYILVHLTLLHGLFPDEVLKGSDTALCHPAWSISVEWQFYLLAPLVLSFIRVSAARALGVLVVCKVLSVILLRVGTFSFQATVVMRAELFALGMGSYYLYRCALSHCVLSRRMIAYLLPAGVTLLWVSHDNPYTVEALWIVLFSTVLAHHVGIETAATRPLRRLLELRFITWLGKLSYSTYLCHTFVLAALVGALNEPLAVLGVRGRLLALLLLSAPPILAISAALHYLVEKPGIQFGKVVASWRIWEAAVSPQLPARPQPAEPR